MKTAPLRRMLELWDEAQARQPARGAVHPSAELIEALAQGADVRERPRWISHLARCRECRCMWADLLADGTVNTEFVADIALPKVAAGKEWDADVTRVPTTSGKLMITLRKNLDAPDSCLVSLNILDGSLDLEGRKVAVRDRNGRRLLEGRVHLGEVSAWLKGLEDIDLSITTVIPGD